MIGVFDSGIGGLNILDKIVKLLPQYDYVYFGDGKNNPFGEKTDEELMAITTNIVNNFKARGCKLIVIACNTATTRCMKKLREIYPDLIFVGTVPAIKVACDKNFKKTLVMATPATIESERTNELVKDNIRDDQEIYLVPCFGLANAIERQAKDEINDLLKEILKDYMDKGIDSVVLGCTHYPYIKKEISSFLPDAELLDGSDGVAREVKHQLELHDIRSTKEEGTVRILKNLED